MHVVVHSHQGDVTGRVSLAELFWFVEDPFVWFKEAPTLSFINLTISLSRTAVGHSRTRVVICLECGQVVA